MIRRLFPLRWAAILAWTAAAVGWCVALFGLAEASSSDGAAPATEPLPTIPPPPTTQPPPVTATTTTTLPELPASGLVIIRYTPVPPPPPIEIVRTVHITPKPAARPSAPAAAPASAPAPPTVTSSGS